MGWNTATIQNETGLTKNFEGELRFYFVHSYFVLVDKPGNSMMKTNYGTSFDSAICQDNIFGAQFHPEKSHKFGMNLFRNFASL
jgi:glutamine amidotransferase